MKVPREPEKEILILDFAHYLKLLCSLTLLIRCVLDMVVSAVLWTIGMHKICPVPAELKVIRCM